MKQTAVDWLVEQLNDKYGNDDFVITHMNKIEIAKQMEKEHIKNAYIHGCMDLVKSSEAYYNKQFKNKVK